MALPNYLAQIKSSGIYRFIWDKSQMPVQEAQMIRLVVGYSEKGPFNTPVYVSKKEDFKKIFGDVNKKLERKGVFFHRMALQALEGGAILCLNLKNIQDETVNAIGFDAQTAFETKDILVKDVFDTSRFWFLDPERLNSAKGIDGYVKISMTDEDKSSNSIFVRSYVPTGYNVTFADWYSKNTNGEEMPEYLVGHEAERVQDYFAEVYVFKGKFTPALAASESLNKYFDVIEGDVYLKPYILNAFGEKIDTLQALAEDSNSNLVGSYSGILLPEFKNHNNVMISLDAQFNADNNLHKMMMSFDVESLYNDEIIDTLNTTGWNGIENIADGAVTCGKTLFSNNAVNPEVAVMKKDEEGNWSTEDDSDIAQVLIYKGANVPASDSEGYIKMPDTLDSVNVLVGDKIWNKGIYTVVERKQVQEKIDQPVATAEDGEENDAPVADAPEQFKLVTYIKAINAEGEYMPAATDLILLVKSFGSRIYESSMQPTYLMGYEFKGGPQDAKSGWDKLQWQKSVMNVMKDFKGIRLALTSRVDLEYRYLVDTFEAFVDEEIHSQFALIAKEKDNCMALLNFPSTKTMSKCAYTSFLNEDGEFDTKFIAEGGNRQRPMSARLSLVREINGASYVGYFTGIVVEEYGVKKYVPGAGVVSNAFMAKYENAFPYSIVAGPNKGKIRCEGLVGPEFNWSRYDLDYLEPFGVNAIIYVPGKGVYINSNKTAKKDPISALSSINVREVCIHLQDKIESILQTYQWESNTPELRSNIKTAANKECEKIQANGGIYDYENVCDTSNNTDEVIDNEMLVLDTAIEPGRGAGKMVQNLTIYRKGGIKAAYTE